MLRVRGSTVRVPEASIMIHETPESAPCAAIAIDPDGKIAGWNLGAEDLLGYRAEEVLGRACHHVLCGRDIFGNRFCHPRCPEQLGPRRDEPLHDFVVYVQAASGAPIKLQLSTLYVYGPQGSPPLLVQIVRLGETFGRDQDMPWFMPSA